MDWAIVAVYLFLDIIFGGVVYWDAKYVVFKARPWLWGIFAFFFPVIGLIIYLLFRKSHMPG